MTNDIRMEKCREYVKYIFSNDEKTQMGGKLAQCFSDLTEKKATLKSVTSQIKSEMAKVEAETNSLSEKIRSGYEHRQVDCTKALNFKLRIVKIVRLDTGETIEERSMTNDEVQMTLGVETAPGKDR